jgi:CheY-like chemotaxis protein
MDENRTLILVIEDHEPTRRALESLLNREGFRVLSASTVAEGLGMLRSGPACVVLDLMLPDSRGEEVMRRVKEARPDVRVIVTTGLDDDAELEAVNRLGPQAVLRKPIEMNEFIRACRSFAIA